MSKLRQYRVLKERSLLTRVQGLNTESAIHVLYSPSLFFLPSFSLGALNFLYISFSFAKFQLADIQPATSSVVIVRHLSVTFYYCLVGYYRHYIPPLSDPPPRVFLIFLLVIPYFVQVTPSGATSFNKAAPPYRRSCRAIHVKPFKLKFIYATALVMRERSSAAFFVSL